VAFASSDDVLAASARTARVSSSEAAVGRSAGMTSLVSLRDAVNLGRYPKRAARDRVGAEMANGAGVVEVGLRGGYMRKGKMAETANALLVRRGPLEV